MTCPFNTHTHKTTLDLQTLRNYCNLFLFVTYDMIYTIKKTIDMIARKTKIVHITNTTIYNMYTYCMVYTTNNYY